MSYVSGRLFTDQVTGITTAPQVLAPGTVSNCREVMIQSDPGNVGNVIVGTALNQFVTLTPGQAITLPIISLTLIYVRMSIGTGTVNWLSRD